MSENAFKDISYHYSKANDHYLTGWNNWPHKQELYKIYWAVKEALEKTSTFAGEDEWLEECKQEKIINKLKGL